MQTQLKTTLAIALTAISFNLFAADFNQTFKVKAGENLELRTDAGKIDINTHNEDTVIIDVAVSGDDADEFTVTAQQQGNAVVVIGEKENRNSWNGLRVKFNILVPKTFNLALRTAGGSIEINDLIGNVDADTSGGSIKVGDIKGNVDLHTSGGSIRTDNIYGEIDAHTSGGSIKVTFGQQPLEDASLTTSGGSITANLPEDIAIELDASTSGGRVKSEFEVNGKVKKQSIHGDINGGGPKLKLRTSGGSVSINKR